MAYLIDTTILARVANATDSRHALAVRAVLELHRRGEVLNVTPQVLIEFRNVATRPVALNGLGLAIIDAEAQAAMFEARFPLLPDSPHVYLAWKSLVAVSGVIGKQVHDARLVAVCHVHGVTHILTFNVAHFARMAAFGRSVVVVDPASV